MNKYQAGDVVYVKVQNIIASGILVRMEDGRTGIIRHKELTWSRTLDDPLSLPEIDTTIQAVLLAIPPSGFAQLSLKRLSGDPWHKIHQGQYSVGSIVTGQVVNLEAYGAFVELEPGIVGLLHKSEIPGGDDREIQDLLWIGDYVEVVIKDIEAHEQRLSLSILEHLLKPREGKGQIGDKFPSVTAKLSKVPKSDVPTLDLEPGKLLSQNIRHILVVDDEREENLAFTEDLRHLGYEVESAFGGQEAISYALQSFDLVFLDFDLPDGIGTEIAPALLEINRNMILILITGKLLSETDIKTLEEHGISAILLKPLDFDEVVKILRQAEAGQLTPQGLPGSNEGAGALDFFADAFTAVKTSHGSTDTLSKILGQLRHLTSTELVVLFQLDDISQHVSIIAATDPVLASETEVLPRLRHSAVRDVAVKGETILENVATANRKFDTLLLLLPFESCVGIAVPYTLSSTRYALFLFDQAVSHFTAHDLTLATAMGYAIAAALHEDILNDRIRKLQNFVLMGQLSASLLHEIANKLNRVEYQAGFLERDTKELLSTSVPESLPDYADRIAKRVRRIRDANVYLRDLLTQYRGLMKREHLHEINVNDLLLKAVVEMAPFAEEHKVQLDPLIEGYLPRITITALRLEQVFLNLMRNAIQLMGVQKRNGMLRIVSQYDKQDQDYPIKIRFMDEGPGIHRQQWDWIFEWGTSTREGGTGLGLFVSKGLMESLGGRLSVEWSCMFVGTTFLVELPVVTVGEAV